MSKKLIKALLLGWVFSFVAPLALAADVEAPEQIVREVSRDVLDIIRKNEKDPAKIRDLADVRLSPLADYGRMTMLAAGRHWRTATPEQQQALVKEFRTMLIRNYLSALATYKNASVDVKGSRPSDSPDEVTVRSEVSLPGQKPISLDFRFEKIAAGWKVFDITVDGISFINTHRGQFNTVIQQSGVDGLIKQLADRNQNARGQALANGK